ncbi:MAG: ferritin-like domain-containing protein [Actinobacteria bacterium]|nr:ferritin-like domain-containing protein [Actinomycetota bacterium]
MPDLFTLEELDQDGAIRETAEKAGLDTRTDFLRKAGLGAGAILGGGALLGSFPAMASAAPPKSDVDILNFALTLEYLEAEFYTEAGRKRLGGKPGQLATVIGRHERAHVAFLKKALGGSAVKKPKFNFKGTTANPTKFLRTARVLEDTGVQAYSGAGPSIKTKSIAAAAISILTVEARHAAWVRDVLGIPPAPAAFDAPKSKGQILAAVKGTGFIVG